MENQFELIENFKGNENNVNYIIKDFSFNDYKASIDRNFDLDEKENLMKDYSIKDKKSYYTKLIKYCENIVKNKYQNKVIYYKNTCGRYYSKDEMNLQFLPNEIRAFLCSGIMTDIDIKNSMPTLIRWYCMKNNILTPYLDMYVEDREKILNDNKDLDKMTFIKSLNSSKCRHTIKNEFFNEFDRETKKIQKKLMELETDEIQNIIKNISEEDKKNNFGGIFLSRLYFTLESEIIIYLKSLLKERNISISSYNFDGLQIDGNYYNKLGNVVYFQDAIREKFNFDYSFCLTFKEYQNIIKIPAGWDGNKTVEDEETAFNRLVVEFEEKHCKIVNNNIYIKKLEDSNVLFSKSMIDNAYCHMVCGFNKKSGAPISFINKWLNKNDNIHQKESMESYPNNDLCPKDCYNLWRPWNVLKMPSRVYTKEDLNNFVETTDDKTDEKNAEGIKKISKELYKILELIFILCNRNMECYKYLLLWLAQMFKYPEVKSKMIIFISEEGAGKGTLLKLIKRMMGNKKVIQVDDPKEQIFGSFNGIMKDAFFVNLNECGLEDMKKDTGKLKQLITDSTILINEKGVERFEMNSYHRFFFTTNNDNPLVMNRKTRRNVVIRSSDELIDNKEYFVEMNEIIDNDACVREFYDYLMNLDDINVREFNKRPIPETEHANNLKELSIPVPEQFIRWLVLEHCNIDEETDNITSFEDFEFGSENLYEKFEEFKGIKKLTFNCNVIGLCVKISNLHINGIAKRYTKKLNYTTFNTEDILNHFKIDFIKKEPKKPDEPI
jgi:hypothetical protein